MRKLLLLFGIGSLGFGAYLYYKRQLEVLEDITYKVVGVKISTYNPFSVEISTELTNDSEISFTIKGYDIDVVVNGQKVAEIKNAQMNEKLKGFGAKSNINFVTALSLNNSTGNIGTLLDGVFGKGIKDTIVKLEGSVSISRGLFEYSNYPVDLEWSLDNFL